VSLHRRMNCLTEHIAELQLKKPAAYFVNAMSILAESAATAIKRDSFDIGWERLPVCPVLDPSLCCHHNSVICV
jgi:hypothetical protein